MLTKRVHMQPGTPTEIKKGNPPSREVLARNSSMESELRKAFMSICQYDHLSSGLFPLQDVLIQPRLLAHIQTPVPDDSNQYSPVLFESLPDLNDSPEILSELSYPSVSLEKAIEFNPRLEISGFEGSGRTTAIDALVSRICRKDPLLGTLSDFLPIKIHTRDLVFTGTNENNPFAPVLRYVTSISKRHDEKQVRSTLLAAAQSGYLILFVDGFDEVLPEIGTRIVQWLQNLLKEFPSLKIVVTSTPHSSFPLAESDFETYLIAPWNRQEKRAFINQFSAAWSKCFQSSEGSAFIPLWLRNTKLPFSPSEMTLFCWSAYTGNTLSASGFQMVLPYLSNYLQHKLSMDTLIKIAVAEVSSQFTGITSSNLEGLIAEDPRLKSAALNPAAVQAPKQSETTTTPLSVTHRQVIQELVDQGFLQHASSGRYFIKNIHLSAALYSRSESLHAPNQWQAALLSSFVDSLILFSLPEGKVNAQVTHWMEETDYPLFRNLQLISRWLTAFPEKSRDLLLPLYRRVTPLIQKEGFPVSLQIRLVKAILLSDDPLTISFLKNLAASADPAHRQTAAFGLSFFQTADAEKLLCDLSNDRELNVQKSACLSLAKLWSHNAQKQLVSLVISAKPEIRQMVAELFAFIPGDGHELLKELSTLSDNPEARKAAVNGLFLVNSDWSKELIKKVNIEDTEWLVRDTAANMIKMASTDTLFRPRTKVPPANQPWLIKFAAARRMGVYAGEFPSDILILVVKEADLPIKKLALEVLAEDKSPSTVQFFKSLFHEERGELQEAVFKGLLRYSRLGVDLS